MSGSGDGVTGQPVAESDVRRAVDPAAAEATEELAELVDRPLAEHPEVYGRLHARLQSALSDIDTA